MALLNTRALGRRCLVCGSAAATCGEEHSETEIFDLPTGGTPMPRPEVIARRNLNGTMTEVLSTHAEAEANGWEVTKVLRPAAEKGPKPYHKKIEKPEAPEPVSPEPATEEPAEEESYDDLYEAAQELEIRGRSKMDRDQLAAAVAEAREEE